MQRSFMRKMIFALILFLFSGAGFSQTTNFSLVYMTGIQPVFIGQSHQASATVEVLFSNSTVAPLTGEIDLLASQPVQTCSAVIVSTSIPYPCTVSGSVVAINVGALTLAPATSFAFTLGFDLTLAPTSQAGTYIQVAILSPNILLFSSNGYTLAVAQMLLPPPPPPPPVPAVCDNCTFQAAVCSSVYGDLGVDMWNVGVTPATVFLSFTDLSGHTTNDTHFTVQPGQGIARGLHDIFSSCNLNLNVINGKLRVFTDGNVKVGGLAFTPNGLVIPINPTN